MSAQWVAISISLGGMIGTLLSIWFWGGRMTERLANLGFETKALRRGLYREDGTLVYRTTAGCDEKCGVCQLNRDRLRDAAIGTMRQDLQEIRDEQAEQRRMIEEQSKALINISQGLSRHGLARDPHRPDDATYFGEAR